MRHAVRSEIGCTSTSTGSAGAAASEAAASIAECV
jgi:hypothetical protein